VGENGEWMPRGPVGHGRSPDPGSAVDALGVGACGPRRLARLLSALAVLVMVAIPARASAEPKITEGPSISGDFTVGGTMTATAKWKGGSSTWTWLRCAGEELGSCSLIAGQSAPTYTAGAQDEGSRLRVRLTVRGTGKDDGTEADAVSEATPPIAGAPAPPVEPPRRPPAPPPAPSPAPAPPAAGAAPQLMDPFPVVRIRGRLTAGGARVTLMTVRASRGARIAVRCAGDHCPRRRLAVVAVVVHLRPYQRVLRAGTRLEIRVTRPSFIGKYTRLIVRRGQPPLRRDRCLMPGSSRPVACPSG
jgi:hypothetical protein